MLLRQLGRGVLQPRVKQLRRQRNLVARQPCKPLVVTAKSAASSQLKPATNKVYLNSTIDPAYVEGSAFLKSVGFTNAAEIARVLDVAMNPNSLFVDYNERKWKNSSARSLSVEADMKPVFEFLLSKGISVGDVVKIISTHPPILCYSVETRLQALWNFLEEQGMNDVSNILCTRPSLFGLDPNSNLKKIVDYLKYVETPQETILKYLETSL